MSTTYKITVSFILLRPSFKPYQLGVLEMSPPKKVKKSLYTICAYTSCVFLSYIHIFCSVRITKPINKKLEMWKKKHYYQDQAQKDYDLAAIVNAFNAFNETCKDFSHLISFTSNKKCHYTTKYLKLKKNKNTSKN